MLLSVNSFDYCLPYAAHNHLKHKSRSFDKLMRTNRRQRIDWSEKMDTTQQSSDFSLMASQAQLRSIKDNNSVTVIKHSISNSK